MLCKVLFVLSASVKTASVNNSGWRRAERSCWAGFEPATRWRVARSPADDFWQRQRTEGMNKTVQAAEDFHVQVFQRIEAVGGSSFDLWADDCVNETTLRRWSLWFDPRGGETLDYTERRDNNQPLTYWWSEGVWLSVSLPVWLHYSCSSCLPPPLVCTLSSWVSILMSSGSKQTCKPLLCFNRGAKFHRKLAVQALLHIAVRAEEEEVSNHRQ